MGIEIRRSFQGKAKVGNFQDRQDGVRVGLTVCEQNYGASSVSLVILHISHVLGNKEETLLTIGWLEVEMDNRQCHLTPSWRRRCLHVDTTHDH